MVVRNKLLSVASGSRCEGGQTGAALVIVLGLVSVMCVTAVVAFNMFGMFARKTANSQMFSQAREYALAGEMLGAKRAGAFIKVNEFFRNPLGAIEICWNLLNSNEICRNL